MVKDALPFVMNVHTIKIISICSKDFFFYMDKLSFLMQHEKKKFMQLFFGCEV
jgi:hypothetical protein